MTQAIRLSVVALAFGLLLASVSGCGYRRNVTPALASYARHHEQDTNRYLLTIDHTTRQAWDDLARILLLDQPSRLTKYPTP